MSIEEYLNSISTLATTAATQSDGASGTSVAAASTASEDCDSYVSTVTDGTEVIPCENYNDILNSVTSKPNASETADGSDEASASGTGAAGGAGGSDSDEDETTTKIVTINGITYLETTTVENGITTTTRTQI
ncbi:MAG: hypothetical protein LUI02_00250, partial [Clostridiales bacterium]|nr:hypothetical protein [Clostridiales bacterium]